MAKHEYKIIINKECKNAHPYCYEYSRTKGIELHVAKNKATIRVEMMVLKSFEDIKDFKVAVLRDAYRKIFLLYGVKYDQNIKATKIIISIDGKERSYDKTTQGFPFIFSMISENPMNLSEEWRNRAFCKELIKNAKYRNDKSLPYIAVNAYLSSKGRMYVTDKFSNLWTAMNAYYKFVGNIYNKRIEDEFMWYTKGYLNDELIKELKRLKKEKIDSVADHVTKLSLNKKDKDYKCMSLIMNCMLPGSEKLGKDKFEGEKNKERRKLRYQCEEILMELTYEQIDELYDYAYSRLGKKYNEDVPEDVNSDFLQMEEYCADIEQELFFFLIFEYPYYCRNEYLHGSKALMLIAFANDKDIQLLFNAAHLVERFLNDKIPAMLMNEIEIPERIFKKVIDKNNNSIGQYKNKVDRLIREGVISEEFSPKNIKKGL